MDKKPILKENIEEKNELIFDNDSILLSEMLLEIDGDSDKDELNKTRLLEFSVEEANADTLWKMTDLVKTIYK